MDGRTSLSPIMLSLALAGCPSPDGPVEHAGAPPPPQTVPDPPPPHEIHPSPGPAGSPRADERTPTPGSGSSPQPYGGWPDGSAVTPPAPPAGNYPHTGQGIVPASSSGIKEKWKAEVGITTFRSTIHFFDGKVVVDSNGAGYHDEQDALDGVWVLDPDDGTTIAHVVPPGQGEKDVTGVALTAGALVFGTDQGRVYKTDWSGKVIWKRPTNGDVESAPALADLDGDTVLDVAVGSEGGTFYTMDGKTGAVLTTFTAGQGYYGATGFMGTPALFDATADGVPDVYVPCRDELFRVIDGETGALVWSHQGDSGLHSAPIVVDADGDGSEEVVFTESYSQVTCADARSGLVEWSVELTNPGGGIEGLFGPVGWYPDAGCVMVATAWWGNDEGVYCIDGSTGTIEWRYGESKRNISSGFVVGDVDGSAGAEAVFGTESGALVALDVQGMPVRRVELGAAVECTPTLADTDGDGLLEILVADTGGRLRLLDTAGSAPAAVGYHRGGSTNPGVL
jgi:hypothetical protein